MGCGWWTWPTQPSRSALGYALDATVAGGYAYLAGDSAGVVIPGYTEGAYTVYLPMVVSAR
jgi:hypothetical protein